MSEPNLEEIAADAVRLARRCGADEAECMVSEGDEFSAVVRMRELETLKEAGSRGAWLRVLLGRRSGSAYTSDLTGGGLRRMVEQAIAVAGITMEDPFADLPERGEFGAVDGDLRLYSDDVAALSTEEKIRRAREAEEAALAADPRIANSEGGGFSSYIGLHAFANSRGFTGSYRTSSCSLSVVPVARDGESMERDYWYSASRSASGLEKPEDVGRIAAERALRRLHARKVPTAKAPVIFEPRTARSLVEHVFEAASGDAIYRNASFLAGRLGEQVASEKVTIIDDGTIPGLLGTSPFDDEGVPSRRTFVIERGVLRSYLLNVYTARKLGLKTTGNASRGLGGTPGIGHGNLYLEEGAAAPEAIRKAVRRGFYVTELLGAGVNIVTGDYSRGAAGLWIEDGEFAFPVSEVTIAGNLREMLMGIEAVGTDLEFRTSTAAPTLLVQEMTVSGS